MGSLQWTQITMGRVSSHERTPFPVFVTLYYRMVWIIREKSGKILMRPGVWPTRHWALADFPGLAAFSFSILLPAGDRKELGRAESASWDRIPARRVPRSRTSLEHGDRCCWRPSTFSPSGDVRESLPSMAKDQLRVSALQAPKCAIRVLL